MKWNHRIVRMRDEMSESGYTLGICEVFYDENGTPRMRNEGATVFGDDIEELERVLERMKNALHHPVLDEDTFEPEDGLT